MKKEEEQLPIDSNGGIAGGSYGGPAVDCKGGVKGGGPAGGWDGGPDGNCKGGATGGGPAGGDSGGGNDGSGDDGVGGGVGPMALFARCSIPIT